MRTHYIGDIQADTPEAARAWLEGMVSYAATVRADRNATKHGDPFPGAAGIAIELAKAILLLVPPSPDP